MRLNVRLLPFALTALMTSIACGPPAEGEGDPPKTCENNAKVCEDDRNCGGGFCDNGCCQKLVCQTNADCEEGKICDVRRGICVPEDLCNPGDQAGCGADEFCTYVAGEPTCLGQAALPQAATCAVAASGHQIDDGSGELAPAVVSDGAAIQLEAVAYDGAGNLIPFPDFAWTGDGVSASGLVTGACAGPAVCEVTATASSGGASCDGVVKVYPAVPVGSSRIVVLDLANGQPLSGVDVSADLGAGQVADVTDADGAAVFDGIALNIGAFPDGYQWNTVLDPPADTIIFTAEIPDTTQAAGIKGRFDFGSVSTLGDIKLGLSGTAIAASITDLDFSSIIGEIADYNVELEGVTDPGGQAVPLPSGLVIGLGQDDIKGDYVTFGKPGPNVAWAIGGKVQLAKVGPIISRVTGSDDINVGGILGAVLPFFATFDHAVEAKLDPLVSHPKPTPPGEDQPVPYAEWDFQEVTLVPNTLLSQSANYTMPDLPCSPGRGQTPNCDATGLEAGASPYATGVVLLSGVIVPGYGLIPLGLTAGLDDYDSEDGDDFDGKLDYDPEQLGAPGKGKAILDYAPPHDGLEGNVFVSVAIALDINSIAGDAGSFGASIITHITDSYDADNTFPAGSFLESQGGTFSPSAGAFALEPVGSADFYRVNFDNGGDEEWNVWSADPGLAVDTADLAPPGVDVTGRVQHADVQAFKLGTGYSRGPVPTDFTDLFAFDGANADNLLYFLGAWSSESCKFAGTCEDLDATE